MQRAQAPLDGVSSVGIAGITRCALHLNFDPIGSSQFEVSLDDGTCEVVHFFERISFAIVEVRLPMPWRVPARTRGAKNEELGVGRPLVFLYIAAVLAIWRLKVLGCQDAAFHVADLNSGFVKRRIGMSTDG
jgi:hypothetical protein